MTVTRVAFAPFVTLERSLEKLSRNLLIAVSPAAIMLVLTGAIDTGVFFSAIAGFVISGMLIRKMRNAGNSMKTDMFLYASWAMAGALLLGGLNSMPVVILSSFISVFIFEYTVDKTGVVFPPFAVLWLLVWPFRGISEAVIQPYVVWMLFAALIYLTVRSNMSFPLLFGFLLSCALIMIYSGHGITYKAGFEILTALVLSSYPGIIPYGNKTRILYGCLCAVLVIWLGPYGFIAAMIMAAFTRRL